MFATIIYVFDALNDYTISLKVVDDSTPKKFDTANLTIQITIPPHPPTAVAGGPYIATSGEAIQLDGSGLYDVDDAKGDQITSLDWETDFSRLMTLPRPQARSSSSPDLFYMVHIKEELEDDYRTKVDIVHYREKMNVFLKKRIDQEAVYV